MTSSYRWSWAGSAWCTVALDMARAAQPPVVNLGPLEAEIMRLVWREKLKTVGEVTTRLNEGRPKPLDYRTVLSTMSNLTKKKLLRHRRHGNTYHFTPTCTEEEFAYRQGSALAAGLTEAWGEAAAAGIADQLAATPEVLARLKALMGPGGPGEATPER